MRTPVWTADIVNKNEKLKFPRYILATGSDFSVKLWSVTTNKMSHIEVVIVDTFGSNNEIYFTVPETLLFGRLIVTFISRTGRGTAPNGVKHKDKSYSIDDVKNLTRSGTTIGQLGITNGDRLVTY